MLCPVCEGSRMREVEKNGILIDICPTCKGVWLDRGELDKLMGDVREARDDYNAWHYRNQDADAYRQSGGAGYAPSGGQAYPPSSGTDSRSGGYPSSSSQGYDQNYDKHYDDKHYNQHGYPRKKKKSVLDVFGDLFD